MNLMRGKDLLPVLTPFKAAGRQPRRILRGPLPPALDAGATRNPPKIDSICEVGIDNRSVGML